jgi:hypothetical protein
MKTRCGFTGKVMFKKEKGALNRADDIMKDKGNRRYTPNQFRAYLCEYCGSYHLTGKLLE